MRVDVGCTTKIPSRISSSKKPPRKPTRKTHTKTITKQMYCTPKKGHQSYERRSCRITKSKTKQKKDIMTRKEP